MLNDELYSVMLPKRMVKYWTHVSEVPSYMTGRRMAIMTDAYRDFPPGECLYSTSK